MGHLSRDHLQFNFIPQGGKRSRSHNILKFSGYKLLALNRPCQFLLRLGKCLKILLQVFPDNLVLYFYGISLREFEAYFWSNDMRWKADGKVRSVERFTNKSGTN